MDERIGISHDKIRDGANLKFFWSLVLPYDAEINPVSRDLYRAPRLCDMIKCLVQVSP
ncbi:MAG: hypothetical protein KBF88_03495 [Polyangiaceae bacterium]|nr:hypothetical protein [Polyangiaceae bacterium]